MKILYVDKGVDGHHVTYMRALCKNDDAECVLVLPQNVDIPNVDQYIYKTIDKPPRKFRTYMKFLKEINSFIKKEKPDVVHFLYGDFFYRYFGAGLGRFKRYKTVMTVHSARHSRIEKISLKLISKKIDKIIVHSDYIKSAVEACGVNNAVHVEYPQFNSIVCPSDYAKQKLGIDPNVKVIGCIGGTRPAKGLDIMLEALNDVKQDFRLLIAGAPEAFDAEYIKTHSQKYADKVVTHLHFLSDEELAWAFNASDIIAVPYRRSFNGASGPLGEGVALGKCIVSTDHGNLGDAVTKNHLGYTFASEDVCSLTAAIEKALSTDFVRDEYYEAYRESLDPRYFEEKYKKLYRELINYHGTDD